MYKNTKETISSHTRTRMVKDVEDEHGFQDELEKFRLNFSSCANRDFAAP